VLRRHGDVVVDPFEDAVRAVIIDAEHGRSPHDPNLG
jgi:hypothetical protein